MRLATVLAAGVLALAAGAAERPELRFPMPDVGVDTLQARRQAQLAAAAQIPVQHDFRFVDRLEESGITFVHRPTPDSLADFKLVHYDHGNAVAVADVDGDGRLDLYFVSQMGRNELWRNLGDGRFADITEQAGVGLADRVSVAASFADVDNDGDPDLFVTTVRGGNVLFRNDGGGRFTDVTAQAGVGYVGHSSGAVFFDYDRDGLLDLFVTNVGVYTEPTADPRGYHPGVSDPFAGHLRPERAEASILYRNLGGLRFADVSQQTGLVDTGWAGDASFADLDGDGYPDLYVLNMQGDDHFWLNQEGKRFVDRTAEWFEQTPWGAMGIKFFDQDNDGRLDLFLTDMHSDMSDDINPPLETLKATILWSDHHLQGGADNVFGNAFYRNDGEPPFPEQSDALHLENYWPWGLSAGDLNADGLQDVFIASSMSFPFRYGINSLLLNGGERFHAAEFVLGVEPRRDGRTHTEWLELDCSSQKMLAHELYARICAGRQGTFTLLGTLGTRSSVIFDLDGDGDLDIVTGEFHAPPQVLVSDLAQRHPVRHLEVALQGTRSNRDGLGAVVRLHAGGAVLTQQQDGKSGYLAQSSMPLWFGLGDREPERLEVLWPSGAVQTVTDLPASGRVEVVEPPPAPAG
ncbi:MAG TPA: CRTAC1 family protein [Thermoanaerobaculia bacterium]|nr:CRTAC1 family protein [Thermoanaerobaculia bacterium]